ncbi:MAG TPA: transcriptional regulator [Candidatus Saccharimonadales bacterium]|nr:transcriptional regulator [Candidatus Saccharimonadales bacterium]
MAAEPERQVRRRPRRAAPETTAHTLGPLEVDRLIHERLRLAILSALAVNESLTFNELKSMIRATDGNLSVHARKLEQARYLSCAKTYAGRLPKTEFRLTELGRRALLRYLDHMEALITAMRERR